MRHVLDDYWPPQSIPCIDCEKSMSFCGTGLGARYDYRCSDMTCQKYGKQQWYARHPGLWCIHPEAMNVEMYVRGHIRAVFLLDDSGTLLPITAQCVGCEETIHGLYSHVATAGFTLKTTEDADWREHHNDPTFTTAITCDRCAGITVQP